MKTKTTKKTRGWMLYLDGMPIAFYLRFADADRAANKYGWRAEVRNSVQSL